MLAHLDDEEVGHLDAVDERVLRHRLVDLGRLQRVENACTRGCSMGNLTKKCNERSRKVEADVAMCPLPSLLRREENRDGVACVPYALHSY